MLTDSQKQWISHLSNHEFPEIYPYNHKAPLIFQQVKNKIRTILGKKVSVCHRGSTLLKIPGQKEIDIYIPTNRKSFNFTVKTLEKFFKLGSHYPLERARFVDQVEDIKIEIFVINKNNWGWKRMVIFENYLRKNAEALEAYRKLKEEAKGINTQEYYRRKNEFINEIFLKATT